MRENLTLAAVLVLAALILLMLIGPALEIHCTYTTRCCSSNSIESCIRYTSASGVPTCPLTHPYKAGTSLSCTR